MKQWIEHVQQHTKKQKKTLLARPHSLRWVVVIRKTLAKLLTWNKLFEQDYY
jgi:hypothetical protein